jgi:hypothetical protein
MERPMNPATPVIRYLDKFVPRSRLAAPPDWRTAPVRSVTRIEAARRGRTINNIMHPAVAPFPNLNH